MDTISTHRTMDVAAYIAHVDAEGERFATAAEAGGLDVAIEACEDWTMRELVRHLGLIHLWAAGNVAFTTDDWLDADDIPDMGRYWPDLGAAWPDDADLVAWYRRTKDNLVSVLRSAPADHECFSFLPAPTPVTMWSRRQASEIAIHRFDAEHARGTVSHFEPDFAADMLDELLAGFAPRPRIEQLELDADQCVHVHADDINEHWFMTIGPDGITTSSEGDEADLTISGSAASLYVLLWNRTPAVAPTLTGDAGLINLWQEACRVRWSGGE